MRFQNPFMLLFLLLIPIIVIVIGFAKKSSHKRLLKFADSRFFDFYFKSISFFYWNLKNVILTFAFFLVVIAMARPQWGKEIEIVQREGTDIVVCIDVSKSMEATDIKPSRIERAVDQLNTFISQLQGDRIGIVAFAGTSYIQCPLTSDYDTAKLFLSLLDTNTIQDLGTNIGDALKTASNMFKKEQKNKIVVIISDGEDLEQNALNDAEIFAKEGMRIYTLGVGSPEGATIPVYNNGNVEYAKDSQGNIVLTKLDISTLSELATIGDGKFYTISPSQSEIYSIMKEINEFEKEKYDSKKYNRLKDQYHYFVFPALILIILESFIFYYKKSMYKKYL